MDVVKDVKRASVYITRKISISNFTSEVNIVGMSDYSVK